MKNQINILSVTLGLFVAINPPLRADVLVSGDVETNFPGVTAVLDVGEPNGGASLTVDGGSVFYTVQNYIQRWEFSLGIGEAYGSGVFPAVYTGDNTVTVTGVGSVISGGATISGGAAGYQRKCHKQPPHCFCGGRNGRKRKPECQWLR